MDIHTWLQTTADREPPDQSQEPARPAFLQSPNQSDRGGRKYRHKRKQPHSNSSIIAPRRAVERCEEERDQAAICTTKSAVKARRRHVADSISADSSSGSGSRQESRGSSTSSRSVAEREAPEKTYERRPRHKTRPERYEHGRKRPRKLRGEYKSKRKRRKSKRTGDGARTSGIVQGFQLKNGVKNQRLTLKPEVNSGLFKHGRASAQLPGRGTGLPDLVFNEMKFLQKPKDHQDEQQVEPSHKKPSKIDQKRRQEEEQISAYFQTLQPAAGPPRRELDVASLERNTARAGNPPDRHRRIKPARPATEVPVELPDNPFLGFGGRGASQDPSQAEKNTGSYLTWSESIVRRSSPPPRLPLQVPVSAERRSPVKQDRVIPRRSDAAEDTTTHFKSRAKKAANDTINDTEQWVQSRRIRGGPMVEMFAPPQPREEHALFRANQSSRPGVVSNSLPEHSLPEHPNDVRSEHGSYHTSDILKIRRIPHESTPEPRFWSQPTLQSARDDDKENEAPRSSSPTGKLLRLAQNAVVQPELDPPVYEKRYSYVCTDQQTHTSRTPTAGHRQSEATSTSLPKRSLRPTSTRLSHSRPSTGCLPQVVFSGRRLWNPSIELSSHPDLGQDEILDDQPDQYPLDFFQHLSYHQPQQFEEVELGFWKPNKLY